MNLEYLDDWSLFDADQSKTKHKTENLMRFKITTLPGDGIGPEVTAEAVRVLQTIAAIHGLSI